ncbi:hypothetical protein TKK_0012850 [Trichogramma kaykai]|uniref:DDE Tnp4 domain-containing protein n=1 Tax=Trichogramma kaykai TaxID=54128 RepID=A0ABD2WM48_9HYME
MSVVTFEYILWKLEDKLQRNWCNLHSTILPEERLVISLRFLATGQSYVSLAFSFDIGVSTVCYIINDCLEKIWTIFQPLYMKIPKREEFLEIAETFLRRWNIPNCLGSIDGKHVRIKKPAHSGSAYFNYKRYFSCVLQAVVDANGKFIFIDIVQYGSQSDGGIFSSSKLKKALDLKKLAIPNESKLPRSDVRMPYYFIGDGAYPLRKYLLKPIRGKNLTHIESNYNKRVSRARVVVENAFGILSQVWRVYHTTINAQPKMVEKIIKATCVLHNIILDARIDKNNIRTKFENDSEGIDGKKNTYECERSSEFQQGMKERQKLIKWFADNPL